MDNEQKPQRQNLQERMTVFALDVQRLVKQLPHSIANTEYSRQLIRSSSSIGANYIEADEALGKGDFMMKMRTSRREAKESRYWLRLLDVDAHEDLENRRRKLAQEAYEFLLILSAIIKKCS